MNIIIIGGSIGGLCAGIALQEKGHLVSIYERSPGDMKDRGAGLVIQPDLMDYLIEKGIAPREVFGVPATQRQVLDDNGSIALIYPNDTIFTSWNYLWRRLKDFFPSANYLTGFELDGVTDNGGTVTAIFKNGEERTADLLIGADGFNSVVREYVGPNIHPLYAGYVAYRGLIPESELTKEEVAFFSDKFSIYPYDNSHLLCYLVPGLNGELTEGKRLYNWVWYQNKTKDELRDLLTDQNGLQRDFTVPAGYLSKASVEDLNQAAFEQLPPVLRDRVLQTAQPFLQVILDMAVPQMYNGNVVVLGDASSLVRPHTASGTAKAYRDAVTLAMSLEEHPDTKTALGFWNKQQFRHAKALAIHGQQLAARSGLGN
ncbi:FAD binding domain-containing protein [Mucilaginibacter gynuensis]|uniref:FAD binding domain-containing protein n=1 Tax=Mucilaginibacter gynuensis TaxID=1302236 RepID=A0ABP8GS76_9SPHI